MHEITVSRVFAAAHAIRLHDGSLEPLHGHNWAVRVTVAADRLDDIGLVMDFHALERIVDDVLAPWHNANLNEIEPFTNTKVNPTAEGMAQYVGDSVAAKLPETVRLSWVSVEEAPGCIATYRA